MEPEVELEEGSQIQWEALEWEEVESQLDRQMSNNLSHLLVDQSQ